ncbi:inositol hexakisphosphate and diphosphoinositol-pentakisphosphate kinase 2-like [Stylophora pistillata]|uniref:inositol hexakisphosphate and diphosphoinositol-pentakisphosphate kinase 2-like n=1 Tax=Stylophora pistillata TaxID=50429 RepID=UPI000C0427D1|nr:inositol hexakisphosphate and diphosphoinositol-pentakisphosphate kinase 2-like [Stylophora pistillata]
MVREEPDLPTRIMSVAQDKAFEQKSIYEPLYNRHDEDGDSNEDDDNEGDQIPKIRIGICAMGKKTRAQPMQEILGRMSAFDCVDIFLFPDDIILNMPVEDWPICDCLISFYSSGFPLEKAIEYTKLRKPFSLNDLEMQYALMDRTTMYSLLESAGIETPRHAILRRDDDGNPSNAKFVELDDSVQIGDMIFHKPFVEKPVDAEDHNVYIYFPSRIGGGSQRLFRKVGNRSSVYSPESSVRKKGSYIYEDFVVTDGVDLKVYTVGPEYAHAEARKSPSLDGKVERDSEGKEIRYPVILNQCEKEMANKVCKMFKQTVCGCDFLRTHEKSYVCDVNGFSFVKSSKKYYDDAAQVLIDLIAHRLAPRLYKTYNLSAPEQIRKVEVTEGTKLELRCVVGIIRHGDRTPKQKMKMEVRHPRFIELFKKYDGFDKEAPLKLKRPTQLKEVLNIARDLEADVKKGKPLFENPNKIHQLKAVLEMYGNFSGINEKIQFKYLGKPRDRKDSEIRKSKYKKGEREAERRERRDTQTETRKESKENEAQEDNEHSLLLILKWGGELTMMGKDQALELGRAFRSVYGCQGQYSELPCCGLLRLHSTYRHDLKIYASDEGRVQMTAAAFAKGFLALEGELAPVLVHLVRSDKNTTEMLDTPSYASRILGKVKHRLHELLHTDEDFKEEDFTMLAPTKNPSLINAMKFVENPYKMCERIHKLVQSLIGQLKELITQKIYDPRDPFVIRSDEGLTLETLNNVSLLQDFKLKSGRFDISLIPDIYDCIKYDVQHNSHLNLTNSLELYKCAKAFADIVIPQEYGITKEEKLVVSQSVCMRLLKKISGDLRHADKTDTHTRLDPDHIQSVEALNRHVRTRLYFTSESHVHSLVNALRYGNLFEEIPDNQWQSAVDFLAEVPELSYMTQIVLLLYEDPKADLLSDKRFHVELLFSPGAKTMDDPEFLTCGSPRNPSTASVLSFATIDTDLDDIEVFEPYDESVYTENDTPRSEIGLDDYNDDSISEGATPSLVGSGDFKRSLERSSDKSKPAACKRVSFEPLREGEVHLNYCLNRTDESWTLLSLPRRRSNTETVTDATREEEDPLPTRQSAPMKPTYSQDVHDDHAKQQAQPKEEESATTDSGTGSGSSGRTQELPGGLSQEDISVFGPRERATSFELVREEDDNQVGDQLQRFDESYVTTIERPIARRYSFGVLKTPPDVLNPSKRKISFELVRNDGKGNFDGFLDPANESPTPSRISARKISSGTASSAIFALQSLTHAIQSTLVVRPHSLANRTSKSRKPPIAVRYEEMTKVGSLNPLRTLHDAVPLKEMDNFFDTFTGKKCFTPTLTSRSRTNSTESNV